MVVSRRSQRVSNLVICSQSTNIETTTIATQKSTTTSTTRKRPRSSTVSVKLEEPTIPTPGDTPPKASRPAKKIRKEDSSDVEHSAFEDEEAGGCCSSDDDFDIEERIAKQGPTTKKGNTTAKTKPKKERKKPVKKELREEQLEESMSRLLPLTGGRIPIPWKGRLGFACINTYLRSLNPPVFSGRTCRLASLLENRHPLHDPSAPPHPTKNRPDKSKPASIARGLQYVHAIGVANAADIIPTLRWNDRFGIKFMRLSSDMFPFASHKEYGYPLDFAADVLAEVGRTVAELGHRVTTHPGQYTQLGSPRKEVVDNAFRDLKYHDEMLGLLKLPERIDRDAVMVIHLGGTFGDKEATLDRFRENYLKLPDSIKRRLVLENDDVSWGVHDLLPICQELSLPLVLDFHHHSIIFDEEALEKEGTSDVTNLYDRIKELWDRKGIRQKMHYSESRAGALTARDRRAHSARVKELPPCPDDMDLMIEAKDKEQAVFELMKTYKLEGWDKIKDVVPDDRSDEWAVYWPEGQEGVLKVRKVRKKKKVEGVEVEVTPQARRTRNVKVDDEEKMEDDADELAVESPKPRRLRRKKADAVKAEEAEIEAEMEVKPAARKTRARKTVVQKEAATITV